MFRDGSVIVCGRLSGDVEVKQVGENNKTLAKWGMAVGERQNADGQKETVWANCQAWHNVARAAQGGKKGDVALCVGRIETNDYGGKTYKNLVCEYVSFMSNAPAQTAVQKPQLPEEIADAADLISDDGVPF